jgi:acyl carrier protein
MNDLQVQSKPNREVVAELVITGVREALALAQGEGAALDTVTEDTFLIGQSAVLDSMGLVTAILEIEQRLADEHEIIVVLADERAMSQKNSPFRSVRSLTDYVLQQIAGQA